MYRGAALAGLTDQIGESVDAAAAYLRERWGEFLTLGPRIIDLQHRAAVAAGRARAEGDMARYSQARDLIVALGELGKLHMRAVDTMRSVASFVGLPSSGLGAIPAAQVTVITGLALTVAWFFRAYAAEERKLDLIERGLLTPEQAAALDVGPSPAGVLGGLTSLGRLALGALALFAVVKVAEVAAVWRDNPSHLAVWRTNPPEQFGKEVFAVWYRHTDDGQRYVHEFGPGVIMEAEDDGTVSIRHRRGRPLWREF